MESVPCVLIVADWRDVPVPGGLLTRGEQALAARLPGWRVPEFTAGRLTARAAAAVAGRPVAEILRAPGGAPVAVPGAGGRPCGISIAHTGTLAAAVAGPPAGPLGADIESYHEENSTLVPMISAPGDQVPPGTDPTLLFSCKEAAYKAYRGFAPTLAGYRVRIAADSGSTEITASCGRARDAGRGPRWLRVRSWDMGPAVVTVAGPDTAFGCGPRLERLPARDVLSLCAH